MAEKTETGAEQQFDAEKALRQVEFYFSDENLPTDKFLWSQTQKNDGWVPLSVICAFKRMQRFRPVEKVAEALKGSKELLEVSEDGESVRRRKPLVEPKPEQKANQFQRSVYAKGFGDETDGTQEELEKFFEQFGPVKQVRLRRTDDKKFKGSVFVEFAELADAEKFVALDPKPKYKDTELLTMSKQAYVEMKAAEHGFTQNANGKKRGRRFNAFEQIRKGDQNKRQKRNHHHGRRDQDKTESKPEPESKPEAAAPAETESKPEAAAAPAETETKTEAAAPAETETKADDATTDKTTEAAAEN